MGSVEVRFSAEGVRLDQAIAERTGASRAKAQAWIAAGYVRVDGVPVTKPGKRLKGETVEVVAPPDPPPRVAPEQRDLEILYEDEDMVVVNKPPGMATHPAPGLTSGTLVNALMGRYAQAAVEGEPPEQVRPGIVHRLDRDTSGVIVVGRHDAAVRRLADAFKNRFVFKRYVAITVGQPPEMTLVAPIGRHPVERHKMHVSGVNARYAETDFSLLATVDGHALVDARPHTGRTHQIRVHLKHLYAPILGDELYGKPSPYIPRQALHAYELRIPHPRSGRIMTFVAPVPRDMVAAWEALGGRWPDGLERADVAPPAGGSA